MRTSSLILLFVLSIVLRADDATDIAIAQAKAKAIALSNIRQAVKGTEHCDCGDCQIMWRTDYAAALAESAKTGKPMLTDFRMLHCVPCDRLEAAFKSDKELSKAINTKYVPVKLYQGTQSNELKITNFPTLLIAGPDRTIWKTYVGFSNGNVGYMEGSTQRQIPLKQALLN